MTFPCTVSNNRLRIQIRVLVNTKVNGFVFIDSELAKLACRHLNLQNKPLRTPCNVRGFDRKQANPITHYIEMSLTIDGRLQSKIPMLIVDLGRQDLIIGRQWAANFDVLINCRERKLIWPETQPKNYRRVIAVKKEDLIRPVNQQHQQDADRRDRQLDSAWRPKAILSRSWRTEQQDQYRTMNQELQERVRPRETRKVKPRRPKAYNWKPKIDICGISGEAFRLILRKKDAEFFMTSLYEIDRILKERACLKEKAKELLEID